MAQQLGSNYYNSPFKFNGKELDEETGFYYYVARYYDPKISIWLSVDPLAEKFPNQSPYSFCFNNPVYFIDPDGRAAKPPKNGISQFIDNTEVYFWRADKKAYEQYKYTDSSREHYSFSGYYTVNSNSKAVGKSVSIDNDASKLWGIGGFAFADGGNNQDPSSLRKGGRDAEWLDFRGLLGLIDLLLGREPGKMTKINPSGKGTNGGGATQMDKVNDAIDAAGAGTSAAKEVNEALNKKADKKVKQSKEPEYIYVRYDSNNSNNNVLVRNPEYDKQKKND